MENRCSCADYYPSFKNHTPERRYTPGIGSVTGPKKEILDGWEADFIEKAAALEHARWSRWHMHMIEKQTPENLKRWARQCLTRYEKLSEEEKESDRREVREYLPLIRSLLHHKRLTLLQEAERRIGEEMKKNETAFDILTGLSTAVVIIRSLREEKK